jgi:hypothetical protein
MVLRVVLNILLLLQLLLAAWYIFITAAWVAVSALLGRPAALPVLSLAGMCICAFAGQGCDASAVACCLHNGSTGISFCISALCIP